MAILKKVWAFLKTHWYIPLILIIGVVLKNKSGALLKVVDAQKESYNKQKTAIENAELEKTASKAKIEEEYERAVRAISHVHRVQNKQLEEKSKKEIKEIVKKHYNNKEALSSEISGLFGVKYVPKKNNNSD